MSAAREVSHREPTAEKACWRRRKRSATVNAEDATGRPGAAEGCPSEERGREVGERSAVKGRVEAKAWRNDKRRSRAEEAGPGGVMVRTKMASHEIFGCTTDKTYYRDPGDPELRKPDELYSRTDQGLAPYFDFLL